MKLVSSALVLLLVLTGCSQNKSPNKEVEVPETVITLEAKSGVLTGTADFGTFAHNSTTAKLVTFSLKK